MKPIHEVNYYSDDGELLRHYKYDTYEEALKAHPWIANTTGRYPDKEETEVKK